MKKKSQENIKIKKTYFWNITANFNFRYRCIKKRK